MAFKSLFLPQTPKNRPSTEGSATFPQAPSAIRLNCISLFSTGPKLDNFCAKTRGGVEDTRLEAKAKAKDTKKIRGQGQGQGQPFRGQTLSRPRTGMLEAKAKDQGHKAQMLSKKKKKRSSQKFFRRSPKTKKKVSGDLQKKKVFAKIFQAISTKKRFPKNFSTAPQNFNFPKNSAVLEPRTGQVSRTWGLEAKAKDLTFEAKAKDFKICPRGRPRGQGRPRGLQLWQKRLLLV